MPGKRLTLAEREEIAVGLARKEAVRQIARQLGRAPSTVAREVARNSSPSPRRYRALPAHIQAVGRARRSRPRKLVAGVTLRQVVAALLAAGYSPAQIAGRLKRDYPHRPELHVSHETIYQALFVQGKGGLRAEITAAVRCGRARRRRPRCRQEETRGKIPGMINISERPAEAADRAVPGHWEGDLIIGKGNKSAVATLAERASATA
jgi:IS30 family transposase